MDNHGNTVAIEGLDRCTCGCKYWEHDQCIDCGQKIGAAEFGKIRKVAEEHRLAAHWFLRFKLANMASEFGIGYDIMTGEISTETPVEIEDTPIYRSLRNKRG